MEVRDIFVKCCLQHFELFFVCINDLEVETGEISLLIVASRIYKQPRKSKRNASKICTIDLKKGEGEGLHSNPIINFCPNNY